MKSDEWKCVIDHWTEWFAFNLVIYFNIFLLDVHFFSVWIWKYGKFKFQQYKYVRYTHLIECTNQCIRNIKMVKTNKNKTNLKIAFNDLVNMNNCFLFEFLFVLFLLIICQVSYVSFVFKHKTIIQFNLPSFHPIPIVVSFNWKIESFNFCAVFKIVRLNVGFEYIWKSFCCIWALVVWILFIIDPSNKLMVSCVHKCQQS